MNNNFMGGSINHGDGWMTTHDPRGDIRHYTGEQQSSIHNFTHELHAAHNTHLADMRRNEHDFACFVQQQTLEATARQREKQRPHEERVHFEQIVCQEQ